MSVLFFYPVRGLAEAVAFIVKIRIGQIEEVQLRDYGFVGFGQAAGAESDQADRTMPQMFLE